MSYKNKWVKKEIVYTPPVFNYPPSSEQAAIFDCLRFDDVNIHGEAGAGSGKSTTALRSMYLEKRPLKMGIGAFNSSIAEELRAKVPRHVVAKTFHAFGRQSIVDKWGNPIIPNVKKGETSKGEMILIEVLPWINPERVANVLKGQAYNLLRNAIRLVSLIKLTLTNERDQDGIYQLIGRYNLDFSIGDGLKKEDKLDEIVAALPRIIEKHREMVKVIDFDDMMWLPIQYDLNIESFDLLYADEWQDANNLMIEYARRMSAGGRIVTIGDRYQSIYGFAGANTESIDKSIAMFDSRQLPLMTCYRCGHKIIEEVNKIMPDLRAFEKNPEGEVRRFESSDEYNIEEIPDGSMVLCRRNAGLIKPCFQLLKKGRKAIIKGKDIGDDLIRTIGQIQSGEMSMVQFVDACEVYRSEKINAIMARKRPSEAQIELVEDTHSALLAISENCTSVTDLKNKISNIFTDDKTEGVTLSSMHKSKGLEADHVVIVQADRIRINNEKMTAEDHIQERNLEYVAKSRAKLVLDLVPQ